MKKTFRFTSVLICILIVFCLASCAQRDQAVPTPTEKKYITVGFSQIGAESDWRRANTDSMKSALTKANGFDLIYMDGRQKQTNQIRALRTFIQQEVDYIVLAPIQEDGFATVLMEAEAAGIPVILVDRMVEKNSPFTCFVGSNFLLEGKKVVEWLHAYAEAGGLDEKMFNIVDIQGTLGSTAQIGRGEGLLYGVEKYGWKLLGQQVGDYTQTKGKEVMEDFLTKYPELNIVYCENDNMAFGAIEALEEAGKKVGTDLENGEIMVLSFDGVSEMARNLVKEGKIACIGECNPLHGPRIIAIIQSLMENWNVERVSYVNEKLFTFSDIVKSITVDGNEYGVENLAGEK